MLRCFFNEYNPLIKNWCLSSYRDKHTRRDHIKSIESEAVPYHTNNGRYLSSLMLSIIIVIYALLYIFIKFIKYTRLKVGKGNTDIKEYYGFCKELIRAK
ncbi:hypothetical protein PCYB_007170 [Plasmodium cynomolgi strain B]|uniref:CYIR protein n=1 Tax=Plasmodium cynomolgi (strain B) TaxID=1120755 RepID=K6UP04_PLACD|nr:hypothetical protein PCYB_007170 [Plasmodium cynomolgi strain B]GAB69968.1 hypothetical protein PCYB_007170 [Plasmodium cynomolgi strain B]